MNVKTTTMIREACSKLRGDGLRLIKGGAWFEWDHEKVIAADPIGAVLIAHAAVPASLDPKVPETMVMPGLIKAAKDTLGVDHFWLYRFWMGYDRGFQILIYPDDDKKAAPTKDEVSEFGIALGRELFR